MQRALLLLLVVTLTIPRAAAEEASAFDQEVLAKIDRAVATAIKGRKLPGGVLWLERNGEIYKKAYGKRATYPKSETMSLDTIFDCASLTKVIATTPSVMKLIEDGKIGLEEKAQKYLPDLCGDPNKSQITIRHLLTHTSGLNAGIRRGYEWSGYENGIALACGEQSTDHAGKAYRYSDINFILLGEIVRRVSKQPLDQFAAKHVFEPLRMSDTRFLPPATLQARLAPTTRMEDESVLRGTVHDPTSRAMGGVTGHAGLFSTAADLARYARMLLNGGELDGVRILKEETVQLMTSVQSPQFITARRGLGWDIDSPYAGPRGKTFPIGSFGHTGWTGTSLWIDPFSRTFLILLSNRNHPSGGRVVPLRYALATLAADAIKDFEFGNVDGSLSPLTEEQKQQASRKLRPDRGLVQTGIDVLVETNFRILDNKTVGLVTNHTGRSRDAKSTIDLLAEADNLNLLTLFSPEHGIRGTDDHAAIKDGFDKKTGLKIHSLYLDKKRKPTPEQLKDLEVLIFDIQDIGCRFYTYISTMGLCMEAAEEAGIDFMVLDRPNPIGGTVVEGPVRVGASTFTAHHDIPVRHGMTTGELALMLQKERYSDLVVTVVSCRNWRRDMLYDQTGLQWINPSPNMRSLTAAILYPGIGLLEFTNLSVGRGTRMPFELVGAPFIDPDTFAKELTNAKIPGLQFVPVRFTPDASKYKNQECGGVRILLKDQHNCRAVRLGLTMARILRRLYPADWETGNLNTLLRHPATAGGIIEQLPLTEIRECWEPAAKQFAERRAKYLLYP